MMKKALLFACLAALALLCAGCGVQDGGSSGAASPPESSSETGIVQAPAASGSGDAGEAEGDTDAALYTLDRAVTVGGRALILRLHGRSDTGEGFERLGISAVDVLEDGSLLQTVSIGQAFDQMSRDLGFEDWVGLYQWTDCWTEDGGLATDDLNFDGFPDLRLMAGAGVVNISYLCWLWDPETEQFTYAFSLSGYDIQIDAGAQQIITETRGGWGQYYTNYYRYDGEAGALLQLKEVHEDYAAQGATEDHPIITVHELIDGEWIQTG